MTTKVFEIWSEGFAATGERGEALFQGQVEAKTFLEACKDRFSGRNDFVVHGDAAYLWGCRLFDNEKAARKSFG